MDVPKERSERLTAQQFGGRIGGLRLRATHDPREYTAAARATFLASFERLVEPDGSLPAEANKITFRAEMRAKLAVGRPAAFLILGGGS